MATKNTGRFSIRGKKSPTEIEKYQEVISKNPDDDRAYVRLAELYARDGNEDKAIEIYEKAAHLFEKKGFLNKAKAVLKQALMINAQHGKINVLLADYDRQSGLVKDAIMRYQTAVNYYARLDNKLAAINILRKMVELAPNSTGFIVKLANMLIAENMKHEAEKLLAPLAESMKGTGKTNDYANVLKLLYTASDGEITIGRDLVNLYLRTGSYTNALTVLQKLIVEDPDSMEFLEKLAFVFEKLGEKRKLIATYKQIAVVCSKRQNLEERDNVYRKILELDPDDREALTALREEGKLRDLISDKIDNTNLDFAEEEDLELDIDIDLEDVENVEEADDEPTQSLETVLKEAKVFMSYRLFSKAIDRIHKYPRWKEHSETIDILIEAYIESGDVDTAGDLLIALVDLKIAKGDTSDLAELLVDAESMLGKDDSRLAERKKKISFGQSDFSEDVETDDIFSGIPDKDGNPEDEEEESPVTLEPVDETEDEVEEEGVLEAEAIALEETAHTVEPEEDLASEFEKMTNDIISELQEPPQENLDELEFYISIEDFNSATQLLQELLINYPSSSFLAGIREILPVREEEDLAGTVNEVRETLKRSFDGETSSSHFYDLGMSHLSMGMFKDAIDYFNKALEIEEGDIRSLMGLSQAWDMAGDLNKSLDILRKVEQSVQDDEQLQTIRDQIRETEELIRAKESSDSGEEK